jgi:hypothetical protein
VLRKRIFVWNPVVVAWVSCEAPCTVPVVAFLAKSESSAEGISLIPSSVAAYFPTTESGQQFRDIVMMHSAVVSSIVSTQSGQQLCVETCLRFIHRLDKNREHFRAAPCTVPHKVSSSSGSAYFSHAQRLFMHRFNRE